MFGSIIKRTMPTKSEDGSRIKNVSKAPISADYLCERCVLDVGQHGFDTFPFV